MYQPFHKPYHQPPTLPGQGDLTSGVPSMDPTHESDQLGVVLTRYIEVMANAPIQTSILLSTVIVVLAIIISRTLVKLKSSANEGKSVPVDAFLQLVNEQAAQTRLLTEAIDRLSSQVERLNTDFEKRAICPYTSSGEYIKTNTQAEADDPQPEAPAPRRRPRAVA